MNFGTVDADPVVGVSLENGRSGFDFRLWRWDFSGSSHASDFKIGTAVTSKLALQ